MRFIQYAFIFTLVLATGCNSFYNLEYESFECAGGIGTKTNSDLCEAAFQKSTNTWIIPAPDPYKLSTFKDALVKVSGDENISISPTHYALRINPRCPEEQFQLETDNHIKIAYTPFNFTKIQDGFTPSLSDKKVNSLYLYDDQDKYSFRDTIESCDGLTEEVIHPLPAIYAVWPVSYPLPSQLDYSIDYDIFLPDYSIDEIPRALLSEAEIEAIRDARDINIPDRAMSSNRVFSGFVVDYDSLLDSSLAIVNLRIRFQLGSNIVETDTDSNGHFSVTAPYGSTYSYVYLKDGWKITESNLSTPVERSWGIVPDNWSNEQVLVYSAPENPIHRAVNHYFSVTHPIDVPYSEYMLRVKMTRNYQNWSGCFTVPLFSAPYIEISNNKLDNYHGGLISTVFHELGHRTHYFYKNNRSGYNTTHGLIKESYASYVSWILCHHYYSYVGGVDPGVGFCWDYYFSNTWQSWKKTETGDLSFYSPLFVDMIDDNNQYLDNTLYNNDPISNLPHSVLKYLVTYYKNWSQIKSKLSDYIGFYFSQSDYNQFVAPYDYYFANN